MKRTAAVLLGAALFAGLTGCAATAGTTNNDPTVTEFPAPSNVYTTEIEFHKVMRNGDIIRCIRDNYANAISCDWDHPLNKDKKH